MTGNIDISGRGYIGGISGHGYVVMDNVSVKGEGTISSTFWCAGGIWATAAKELRTFPMRWLRAPVMV